MTSRRPPCAVLLAGEVLLHRPAQRLLHRVRPLLDDDRGVPGRRRGGLASDPARKPTEDVGAGPRTGRPADVPLVVLGGVAAVVAAVLPQPQLGVLRDVLDLALDDPGVAAVRHPGAQPVLHLLLSSLQPDSVSTSTAPPDSAAASFLFTGFGSFQGSRPGTYTARGRQPGAGHPLCTLLKPFASREMEMPLMKRTAHVERSLIRMKVFALAVSDRKEAGGGPHAEGAGRERPLGRGGWGREEDRGGRHISTGRPPPF
ncbi:hypothetical protein SBADM41S_00936 [Streptomyces badius]